MATQDVISSTLASLAALAAPATGTSLAALETQKASLLTQLASVQAQIDAAMTDDAKMADRAARVLQQLMNRVPGLADAVAKAQAAAA